MPGESARTAPQRAAEAWSRSTARCEHRLGQSLVLTVERQMVAVFINGKPSQKAHVCDAALDNPGKRGFVDAVCTLLLSSCSDSLDDHVRRPLGQLVAHVLPNDLDLVLGQGL